MDIDPFIPLKTERLTLRPYQPDDAPSLHRLLNDWEVCRDLAAVPVPYALAAAEAFIAKAGSGLREGTAVHLAVVGRDDQTDVLVGGASLHIDDGARSARLGYWVGRRFWGHGVATEAVGRLARWAFANLDLDRLEANVAVDNPASVAVLRRIGFLEAGMGEQEFLTRGTTVAVHRFEATRDTVAGNDDAAPVAAAGDKPPLLVVAACALVDRDGRVLLARRPEGKRMAGLWEFPGGKLEDRETPEAALIRELQEELSIDVSAACLAPFAFASHGYPTFHLLMPLYLCRRWTGIVQPREGQTLAWVRPDRLADYAMPPADRPLIPLLRDFL